MSDIAIKIENVSKQYRLGLVSTGTLSHDLNRWWATKVMHKEDPYLKVGEVNDRTTKGSSDYVWALKDINMEIRQGDVVGIIGKNGAGKSTLLKLFSRVTAPTTGTIQYKGRIASLLEVGTGFHPELTGRENIYMNGAIMGMNKAEITRKLDEIVDFSGCERYLDTPVKRYSSGMTVRLGFAIAAHIEPDILVVDEVLAVGDAEFQKKAIGKMQDVSRGEGRTVLFVSHNMASIKQLCNVGYVLQNGLVAYSGSTKDAVDFYIGENTTSGNQYFDDMATAPGNDVIRIKSFEIYAGDGRSQIDIESGVKFKLTFMCYKENAILDVNMRVVTLDNVVVFQVGQSFGRIGEKDSKKGQYTIEFEVAPYTINAGKYKSEIFFGENQRYVVFSGFEQNFEVNNTLSDMGFNQGIMPGLLRPKNDFKIRYEG